jgi:hypothetical protein
MGKVAVWSTSRYYHGIHLEELRKPWTSPDKTTGMPAEIQTDYLKNKSQSSWLVWYFITLFSNVTHYDMLKKDFLFSKDVGLSSKPGIKTPI